MPRELTRQIKPGLVFSIWKIEENENWLYNKVNQFYNTTDFEHFKSEQRKLQWLTARVLLKEMCEELSISFLGTYKDDCSKTFLKSSNADLSISHTDKYVAVVVNLHGSVGIDLEQISEKPFRVSRKFMNEDELEQCSSSDEEYTFYWAAKEAVYKWYGKKKINFNSQIIVQNKTKAILKLDNQEVELVLLSEQIGNMFLVISYAK